jgi:hypothetical protein
VGLGHELFFTTLLTLPFGTWELCLFLLVFHFHSGSLFSVVGDVGEGIEGMQCLN